MHQWILETGSGAFDWTDYYENIMPGGPRVEHAIRRDTIVIQSNAYALIRFVADNPGLWAFHCHITWHLASGLMFQFMERADVLPTLQVPSEVQSLCLAAPTEGAATR